MKKKQLSHHPLSGGEDSVKLLVVVNVVPVAKDVLETFATSRKT